MALRRVYYLESEYFLERIEELDELKSNKDPEDPFQEIRPPYLPHPEMRETIPNVSLNSVLYQLPNQLKEYRGAEGDEEDKSLLERQLDATVNFFDKCIPNQPGFTSSVVAVTIVPDAKLVKDAWMKWYSCGKKFRRLKYIKDTIEKRRQMQADGVRGVHDYVDTALKAPKHVAKATGHAAKATGKAMINATDRVCGTSFFGESQGQKGNSSAKEANELTADVDAKDGETTVGAEPGEDDNGATTDDNTNHPPSKGVDSASDNNSGKNEQNAADSGNGSWFGNVTVALGLAQKDETSASADNEKKDVEAETEKGDGTDIEASVYHDAQPHPGHRVENDANPTESGVYFDAKSSRVDTERTKSPKTGYAEEHFEYQNFDPEEFAKWIGFTEETTCDEILDTLGIEQLSVYSREMSQSASNPCVYGCNEQALSLWSIEELEGMLEDAWDDVREANAELLRVRADIFRKENKITEKIDRESKATILATDNDIKLTSIREIEDAGPMHVDMEMGVASHTSSERSGLRMRAVPSAHTKYKMAIRLVNQMNNLSSSANKENKTAGCCDKSNFVCFAKVNPSKVTKVLDHPSFAIVTFTSRQSAIAARQCLADGKGTDRWDHVDAIPVPPLADAPPRNFFFCRGCCRPVTLTINPKERKAREVFVWTFYFFFCCFYTIPLALTSAVLNPTYLAAAFPDSPIWQNSDGVFYRLFAGLSSGMLYSLFFSVLPQIFKYLAFMLGTASTVHKGEDNALQFYWYFMLVTAFTGSTLATMLLNGLLTGNFGEEFRDALTSVARTIPTSQAPVWLNWMITRTFITLPMNYLFQLMTFLYGCIRFKWLNRVMRGGG